MRERIKDVGRLKHILDAINTFTPVLKPYIEAYYLELSK